MTEEELPSLHPMVAECVIIQMVLFKAFENLNLGKIV